MDASRDCGLTRHIVLPCLQSQPEVPKWDTTLALPAFGHCEGAQALVVIQLAGLCLRPGFESHRTIPVLSNSFFFLSYGFSQQLSVHIAAER
jgi:hypothetical protein